MAKERFTWIGASCFTRSFGGGKPAQLEQGKTYDAAGFPPAVLAEWEKTGHLKFVGKAKADPDKED